MEKLEQAREILNKYNQEHIKLDNQEIINQVLSINFDELEQLYKMATTKTNIKNIEKIQPVKAINPGKLEKCELDEYKKIGESVIKNGKYAVAIMAGGQGTRLGHTGPKGTFPINLNSKVKTLFEVSIEKLKKAREKYGVYINCYIMTSPENNIETIKAFENASFWGYPKEYIKFFKQNELPLLDKNGKLVIGEDGLIKFASDGNGGIFNSMARNEIIEDMEEKQIEWIFIGSVDNILVQYVDPLLLGITIKQKKPIGTKTIIKNCPEEKVGVLCKNNNRIEVIEYTEISEQMRNALNEQGELLYGEGHIMCNLYSIEAIKKLSNKRMNYHVATKKSKYIDENGNLVIPKEPNCYKFEQFIFDSFNEFESITVVRGIREQCFAPIKNKEGVDSPETAKQLYERFVSSLQGE